MTKKILHIIGTARGERFQYKLEKEEDTPHFRLMWKEEGEVLQIQMIPKEPLIIQQAVLSMDWSCQSEEMILMNGYQSWTDTHEKSLDEKESKICGLAQKTARKYALDRYGDVDFTRRPQKAGQFHGVTYCYFRMGNAYRFLGSLSERSGYTIYYYDGSRQKMNIEKECITGQISELWEIFALCEIKGTQEIVFDRYFEYMNIPKTEVPTMTGYTSWYNHYQNISEKLILDNLQAAAQCKTGWDIFQIDDGYQTHVGDWLSLDTGKFDHGMEVVTSKIHQCGMKAGLWLAPFVCEKDSDLYREHSDWLIRGVDGEPYCAGNNWSGFYPLDLEQDVVREYLKQVFDVVLNQWHFDMVKLDFLYAACMLPREHKTRGQQMCEAMDLLRELVGDKLILGCGVPLGPAFGKVDFCGIGLG